MNNYSPHKKWKNVFVLCTGRCGSTTFVRAAAHAKNFSAGHETRTHLTGAKRFDYPLNHIEADNRLSWLLGRLDQKYGAEAFYVHLTRDPEAVAASLVKRADMGIMRAYRKDILMRAGSRNKDAKLQDFALDYVDTVTENIRLFLRDKPASMQVCLETAKQDFAAFWDRVGADGSIADALLEWQIRYNRSAPTSQAGYERRRRRWWPF